MNLQEFISKKEVRALLNDMKSQMKNQISFSEFIKVQDIIIDLEIQMNERFGDLESTVSSTKDEIVDIKMSASKTRSDIHRLISNIERINKKIDYIESLTLNGFRVEVEGNKFIEQYYKQFTFNEVRDIKEYLITLTHSFEDTFFNNKKKKNTYKAIVYEHNNFSHLTEFDGLFSVYNTINKTYTLVIVESKLLFTAHHIEQKLIRLKMFKELLQIKESKFLSSQYYNLLHKVFDKFQYITVAYCAFKWDIEEGLDNLYIFNNNILYKDEVVDEKHNTNFERDIKINELFENDTLYKLTERPDLRIIDCDNNKYKFFNEPVHHGGSDEIDK